MKLAERLLAVARTDRTFERCDVAHTAQGGCVATSLGGPRPAQRGELRGRPGWSGRCLHCKSRLVLEDDGTPVGEVTLEHIVPRSHGGTDDLENLGLACARCNHGKGVRIDRLPEHDERYQRVVGRLVEERRRRWRDPDDAPPPPRPSRA